jgi:hypothetical protein
MPRLEPVMTATWPVRSKGVDFMLLLHTSFRGAHLREPGIQRLLK